MKKLLFLLLLAPLLNLQAQDDWANLKKYAEQNKLIPSKTKGQKRVVFMGDSITEGWYTDSNSIFKKFGYLNRGISGQTTPQMLIRLRPDVIDLDADVIVILAGINDIAENTGPITVQHIFGNIVSMIQLARANHIEPVLCSVLPAYSFPWRPSLQPVPKVMELNALLKQYAVANGIIYVDYFSAMADERKGLPKNLAGDEVHPTPAGYRIMEPLVQAGIEKALIRKGRVLLRKKG